MRQVSPLYTRHGADVLAVQLCASLQRHDVLTFELPPGWRDGGRQCVAALYEMPQLFALDDPRAPVLRAPWTRCRRLLVNQNEVALAPVLRLPEKGASYVPRLLSLDDLVVNDGLNRLDVYSRTGERVCAAVMLVAPRSVEDAVAAISAVPDEAANEAWGHALLQGGGAGDIEMVGGEVSLQDPLLLGRISTPVRGRGCTHFQCFDLAQFLQFHSRYLDVPMRSAGAKIGGLISRAGGAAGAARCVKAHSPRATSPCVGSFSAYWPVPVRTTTARRWIWTKSRAPRTMPRGRKRTWTRPLRGRPRHSRAPACGSTTRKSSSFIVRLSCRPSQKLCVMGTTRTLHKSASRRGSAVVLPLNPVCWRVAVANQL